VRSRGSEANATEDTYWKMLLSQDPTSLCRRTLATFDARNATYTLKVADLTYTIATKSKTIAPEVDAGSSGVSWEVRLLILAYLTGATETPLVGKWVSPVEFSGGDLFFSSDAHNLSFADLLLAFKSPEDFLAAGQKLGAKRDKIGDSSFVLQTVPRIPMLFIYWVGDAELPSKISVLVDQSARSHLAIDGLWLAIRVSEKRLLHIAKSMNGPSVPI